MYKKPNRLRKTFLAFLIVGHENFGKSKTLVELTKSKTSRYYYSIDDIYFRVQRTSNADIGGTEFLTRIDKGCHLLATFCPNFNDSPDEKKHYLSETILETLKRDGFELHFFVLHNQFNGDRIVEDNELHKLNEFGSVEMIDDEDACTRSELLSNYIESIISDIKKQITEQLQDDPAWYSCLDEVAIEGGSVEVFIDPENISVDFTENSYTFEYADFSFTAMIGGLDGSYVDYHSTARGSGIFCYSDGKVTIEDDPKINCPWDINDCGRKSPWQPE